MATVPIDPKERGSGASVGWRLTADQLRPPVEAHGDSIVFRPAQMHLGRFYLAEARGRPYIYRRTSGTEVEVYRLTEQDGGSSHGRSKKPKRASATF